MVMLFLLHICQMSHEGEKGECANCVTGFVLHLERGTMRFKMPQRLIIQPLMTMTSFIVFAEINSSINWAKAKEQVL